MFDTEMRPDGLPQWMDVVDTTGKPIGYCRRLMAEMKQMFNEEGRKLQADEGVLFSISKVETDDSIASNLDDGGAGAKIACQNDDSVTNQQKHEQGASYVRAASTARGLFSISSLSIDTTPCCFPHACVLGTSTSTSSGASTAPPFTRAIQASFSSLLSRPTSGTSTSSNSSSSGTSCGSPGTAQALPQPLDDENDTTLTSAPRALAHQSENATNGNLVYDLSRWDVLLKTEFINPESKLARDLTRHKVPGIVLEMSIPPMYPMEPPFVRVKHPRLEGGYIFPHGAICFEPLTPRGWSGTMTLMALAISIKAIFDYKQNIRVMSVGDVKAQKVEKYSKEGAMKDFKKILSVHNEGDTWSRKKKMKS